MADVNESNIFVTSRGEVRLIDCDSFQISLPSGTVYPCEVGTGFWTPPELQGKSFSNVIRTEQHDAFGLAVLIFHVLFMGKHPFAGVPISSTQLENPPSLEECIRRYQFAYTRKARVEFKTPPYSLQLSGLPESIADLFERAFISNDRPSAALWHRELGNIQFQKCQWGHTFFRRLSDCPWCAIWNSGGPNFFIAVATVDTSCSSAGEIERLLADINRAWFPPIEESKIQQLASYSPVNLVVPGLGEINLPVVPSTPFPSLPRHRPGFIAGWVCLVIAIASCIIFPAGVVLWIIMGFFAVASIAAGPENPDFTRELKQRTNRPGELYSQIQTHLESSVAEKEEFLTKFKNLRSHFYADIRAKQMEAEKEFKNERDQFLVAVNQILQRYRAIPEQRKVLRQRRMEITQKEDYLRNFRLNRHKIPHIGPFRSGVLANFGILTAWDVKNMGYVPKLGQGDSELRAWVMRLERSFQFNRSRPLSDSGEQELRRDIQKLENAVLDEFRNLKERWNRRMPNFDPVRVRTLRDTKIAQYMAQLQELNRIAEEKHKKREVERSQLLRNYAQALANSKSVPTG
jgi:DNA-binding helix-hairpin-helix protein with protein kinase domain